MSQHTVVHVVRHGEVDNPEKVLYGRLPGYHLSALGQEMAERAAKVLANHDVVHLVSSPLERAQETAAPIAAALSLPLTIDERLIESENVFEGSRVGVGDGVLKSPSSWKHLYDPFTPSWGEPYRVVAARVRSAIMDARLAARGHEAVLVSHQLPIWITRLSAEGRPFLHDPRKRECSLGSITTYVFDDNGLVAVEYQEPSADLLRQASRVSGA
jgi:broad specificity phosphatase PhoE